MCIGFPTFFQNETKNNMNIIFVKREIEEFLDNIDVVNCEYTLEDCQEDCQELMNRYGNVLQIDGEVCSFDDNCTAVSMSDTKCSKYDRCKKIYTNGLRYRKLKRILSD